MVSIISAYKPLMHGLMRLAGVRPQRVEIEPGTVMNIWVPVKPTNKPVVVLLHGFAIDGILTWQFQVLSLAKKYAVYVPDFLFFGGSITDKPERSPEFQAWFMAMGLKKLGVERCTLVGLSYGGMVGFKMAEMYPELVESMVVSCSVMALTESITKAGLERIGEFSCWADYLLPESVQGVRELLEIATYKFPWLPNCIYKDILETISYNRKEKTELLEALVVKDKDFTIPQYPNLKVHLLWGIDDKIFNMDVAHNLKKQLGEKAKSLQYIEKAGHIVPMERPCVYSRRLNKILASLFEDGKEN